MPLEVPKDKTRKKGILAVGPPETTAFAAVGKGTKGISWRRSSRDIAVEQLEESQISTVRDEVEGLGLDAGPLHGLPFQVILCQLSVWRFLRLLRDGLDGFGSVDGLLSAGNSGEAAEKK
jgi:hypothetical protein